MKLKCPCGNETDFREVNETWWFVDGDGNREQKTDEVTRFECRQCGADVKG